MFYGAALSGVLRSAKEHTVCDVAVGTARAATLSGDAGIQAMAIALRGVYMLLQLEERHGSLRKSSLTFCWFCYSHFIPSPAADSMFYLFS